MNHFRTFSSNSRNTENFAENLLKSLFFCHWYNVFFYRETLKQNYFIFILQVNGSNMFYCLISIVYLHALKFYSKMNYQFKNCSQTYLLSIIKKLNKLFLARLSGNFAHTSKWCYFKKMIEISSDKKWGFDQNISAKNKFYESYFRR